MPAHIYFRTGDYDASVTANEAAIRADKIYLRERNPKGIYPTMYVSHNIQFLWASYMMEGNSRGAFKAARELDDAVSLDAVRQMPPMEAMSLTRYFTEARFGKWEAILKREGAARGSELHPCDLAFRARPRVRGEESSRRCAC